LINFILILSCDWNCFAQWTGRRRRRRRRRLRLRLRLLHLSLHV